MMTRRLSTSGRPTGSRPARRSGSGLEDYQVADQLGGQGWEMGVSVRIRVRVRVRVRIRVSISVRIRVKIRLRIRLGY